MNEENEALLAAVDRLAPVFTESGLDELEVEAGEIRIRLARSSGGSPPVAQPPAAAAPVQPAAPAAPSPAPLSPYGEPAPGMRFGSAPLTGIWYAAPSPGARPYVTMGGEIAAGQVVGLIEAMKLFNEIKSDVGGRVVRMLVEDGTLVKRQQPLIEIDPS
jgi:acetyl-CoA carboxylase biotin carboxyl carrier protein